MSLVIYGIDWEDPVQGGGEVDGVPFYFWARNGGWSMSIGEDPVRISVSGGGWNKEGEYKNSSYMPHEIARQIIEECAEEYRAENGSAGR